MDGLEAVADVRQRAGDDDAHRVVEVRDAHLVLDADGSDVAQVVGHVVGSPRIVAVRRSGAVDDGARVGRDGDAEPGEAAAVAAARDVVGAPGRWRMPGERAPELVGELGRQLRERVADDPRPVAVVVATGRVGLGAQERDGRVEVDRRSSSGAPRRGPSGRRARRRR